MPGNLEKCSDQDKDATMVSFADTDEDVIETKGDPVRVFVHLSNPLMSFSLHDISLQGGDASIENITRLNSSVVSFLVRTHNEFHRKDIDVWIRVASTNARHESNVLTLRYVFFFVLKKKIISNTTTLRTQQIRRNTSYDTDS